MQPSMFFAYPDYKISMAVRQICFIAAERPGGVTLGEVERQSA
jgi:hypothetical protein